MHTPVFLKEVINALDVKEGKKYIEATFGEGGHSREILKKGGQVLGIEWDEENIKYQKSKIKNEEKLKLVWGNFRDIEKIAKRNNFFPVDGILFDLGLSMEQLKKLGRGFSFKNEDEPLDMRISKSLKKTAAEIINSYSAQELYEIFSKYSEEINSWAIAQAIVRARRVKRIELVGDLAEIIRKIILKKQNLESVLRRVFQSLRIAVNNEFENLTRGLEGAVNLIKKSGVIVVITFHSLEDRRVKNFIRERGLKIIKEKSEINRERHSFERTAQMRVFSI